VPFSVSRIKQLWPWLVEARFAWLTLGVIGAALIVSLRPHTSESVIRLTGLVLQLLGIGTVIWGISETRALFGHPSFAAKAKSWFERFPLRRRNIVLAVGAASLAAATCKARGYVTQGPGSNPTVGTRLDALERNVSLIHERISGIEKEMDEESGKRLKRSRMKSTKDKQRTTLFARSLRPQGRAEYTSQLLEHHGFLSG